MGKSEREKGKRGEREVAAIFTRGLSGLGLKAERNLEESREGSYDVRIITEDGEEQLAYAIQVKNWKKTGLHRAISEAWIEGYDPIGVSRETINGRREWVAAIPLSLLVELIAEVES